MFKKSLSFVDQKINATKHLNNYIKVLCLDNSSALSASLSDCIYYRAGVTKIKLASIIL